MFFLFFFFNDTATTEIYTLSLHDALPISIHTAIGDHGGSAKVNGKMVPLKYQLRSGDTVEISTSPTQVPHRDWLKFVRTPRAKNKIKHWLRVEEAKRSLELGKRLLERELRRH